MLITQSVVSQDAPSVRSSRFLPPRAVEFLHAVQVDVRHETDVRCSNKVGEFDRQDGFSEAAVDAEDEVSEPAEDEDGGDCNHAFGRSDLVAGSDRLRSLFCGSFQRLVYR